MIDIGVPVNAVTLAGPVVASVVFLPAFYGNQTVAGLVLIGAGAFDVLDGAVARISGKVTSFGGYLDSVTDRYTDFAVFFGILLLIEVHWLGPERHLYLVLWALSVMGTSATSYVRARAESLVERCDTGFMERPERIVTVIIGLLAGNVHVSLWILAPMTNLTAIQRIMHARLQMEARHPRGRLSLWAYPRLTAPHFALCTAFILFLILGHHLIPRP